MKTKNGVRQVYAITHDVTGKTYVGSSWDALVRFNTHMRELRNGAHPVEDMQADYNEYGEHYTFKLLDECHSDEEADKEYEWMLNLRSNEREHGYNYKDRKVLLVEKKERAAREEELRRTIRESKDPKKMALAMGIIICAIRFGGTKLTDGIVRVLREYIVREGIEL